MLGVAEHATEAGFPPGVLNLLPGTGMSWVAD